MTVKYGVPFLFNTILSIIVNSKTLTLNNMAPQKTYNKILNTMSEDKSIISVLHFIDAQIMWRKTQNGEILFAPLTLSTGWRLQKKIHVAFFIVWSITCTYIFLLLLMFPVWLRPLSVLISPLHSLLVYLFSPLCLMLLYVALSKVILYKIKAIKINGRLVGIDQNEFRSYLISVSKWDEGDNGDSRS